MADQTRKPDANALLFGSSAPSVSFENPGDTVKFRVIKQSSQHRRKLEFDAKTGQFSQGDLMYWNDGSPGTVPNDSPVYNPVLEIRTTYTKWEAVRNRAKVYGEDDGVRRLFLSGPRIQNAIRDAFKAAEMRGKILPGQYGEVTFTKLGKPANKQAKPPMEYSAKWYPEDAPPAWAKEINEGPPPEDSDAPAADDDDPFN